jgi:hypothetical protein
VAQYRCTFETSPKSVCGFETDNAVTFSEHWITHGDAPNLTQRPLREGPGRRMQGRKPSTPKKPKKGK